MSAPYFSVIMPVYGVEKYLRDTLDSVLRQTFADFELILVDDCSKDGSGKICDEVAASDGRVRVIHKEKNGGASSARNLGTKSASGKYLYYMDSDDKIDSDIFEKMYSASRDASPTVVMFGAVEEYYDKTGKLYMTNPVSYESKALSGKENVAKEVIKIENTTLFGYLWNKIYLKDAVVSSGVTFCDMPLNEDFKFNIDFFRYVDSMVILDDTAYHYAKRDNQSLTCRSECQRTAIELIKEAGLEVGTVDQSYNDDVDEGKVAEQTPNGNTKKPKGSKVNLVISKGPKPSEKVEVPQLVGLTKDQAEAALASVGLKGNATEEANEADEGQVFEQGTDAGKEVEKGTTISYKVSSGPDTTSVPDLTDMTEAQARNALDMAGFGVDVSYQENDSVTEGTVISWNPSGKQKPGATITVVIAKKSGKASVPGNLYGKSISAAVTALNNAGFYNIAFCDQNGNPVSGNENATVTGVSPTGKQSTDSTITLTVSLSGSASGDDSDTTTN